MTHLNGSEQINIIPVGEPDTVKINSSWPSPSFNGAFLLPAAREIKKDCFSASWEMNATRKIDWYETVAGQDTD